MEKKNKKENMQVILYIVILLIVILVCYSITIKTNNAFDMLVPIAFITIVNIVCIIRLLIKKK